MTPWPRASPEDLQAASQVSCFYIHFKKLRCCSEEKRGTANPEVTEMKHYCVYPGMTKIIFSVEWRIQIEVELEKSFKTRIVHYAMWLVRIRFCYCSTNDLEFPVIILCLGGAFAGPCILLSIRFNI